MDKAIREQRDNCPNRENHTEGPEDYLAWYDWVEEMAKTHKQKKCPKCNLFMIWEGRVKK